MRADSDDSEADASTSLVVTVCLAAYVFVSLTIPYWVPIVKRFTGDCGVYWVRAACQLQRPKPPTHCSLLHCGVSSTLPRRSSPC